MAPLKPHRRTTRARVAARSKSQLGKYAPPSPTENNDPQDPAITDSELQEGGGGEEDFGFGVGLKLNKKDKRSVRHNTLLNRVREGGVHKSTTSTKKRRRPGKKLHTDISGLGDALPDIDISDDDNQEDEWEGISEDEVMAAGLRKQKKVKDRSRKMEMKSLKHKPGAMKRKGVMEGRERERFGRNLAGLLGGQTSTNAAEGQSSRWAALRSFIEGTMERDRAFGGK